jgi:putative aldouronate transport system substrate-binding protein
VPQTQYKIQQKIAPKLVFDASYGLYSDTLSKDGARIGGVLTDLENQIMQGKKPVSDWAPAVQTWLSAGGTKIKAELEQAHTDAAGR